METFFKTWKKNMKIFYACKKHKSLVFVMEKKLVNNYIFEIDIKNTRKRCKLCSKITIKTPKLFFLLLTLSM